MTLEKGIIEDSGQPRQHVAELLRCNDHHTVDDSIVTSNDPHTAALDFEQLSDGGFGVWELRPTLR